METIKKGSKGEAVKTLQKFLHLLPDGIFGPLTEEALKAFQRTHALYPDGICGPKTWALLLNQADLGATQPVNTVNSDTSLNLKKATRPITRIIIHCTATPEGKDYTVSDIRSWHKAQGWSDIGYHYVIYRDGSIHEGRNINLIGAHTTNYNTGSIGICYVGGITAPVPGDSSPASPKDTRTPQQKQALLTLLKALRKLYPKATIHGHREFANKACPSFDCKEYKNT